MSSVQKSNIEVIQYLRGVAALMVVIFHASREVRDVFGYSAFSWGEFGVDIFFVISGFVMIYSVSTSGPAITATAFVKNRALRIVPLYWLLTGLMALSLLIKPNLFNSASLAASHFLQSLFFIPHYHPKIQGAVLPMLVPGWTLNYEMYFYLILAVFIRLRGLTVIACVTSVLLILFTVSKLYLESSPIFKFLANPIAFEFSLGMLVCEAYLRGHIMPLRFSVPLIFLSALAIVFASNLDYRFETVGLYSAVLVYSSVCLNSKLGGMTSGFLRRVGDSSYSLYLSHVFVIGLVSAVWRKLFPYDIAENVLTSSIYILVCLISSVLTGFLLFYLVESKIIRFYKKPSPHLRPRPS